MNSIMLSALAAFGLLGLSGAPSVTQSDPKKMDECCPKRTEDCCSMKKGNCCEKNMEGCCEKMLDECCTRTMVQEGKASIRRRHCVQPPPAPAKVRVEVKPEDRQPDDDWGYKTVGKNTVKAYYRWVDPQPEPRVTTDCSKATSTDDCSYGYFTVGKNSVRRNFCMKDGERVFCGDKAGECGTCRK